MSVTPPVVLHSERNNSPSPPLFPSSFYAGHNSVLTRGRKGVVVGFGLGQCISRCASLFPSRLAGGNGSTVVISSVLFVCRLWAPSSSFHFFIS